MLGLLLVIGSYWFVYRHGRSVERAETMAALAKRDSGDRKAKVLGNAAPGRKNNDALRRRRRRESIQRNNTWLLTLTGTALAHNNTGWLDIVTASASPVTANIKAWEPVR